MLKTMSLDEKVAKYVPISSSGRPLLHYSKPLQAIYFSCAMHSGTMLGHLITPEGCFQRLNSTKVESILNIIQKSILISNAFSNLCLTLHEFGKSVSVGLGSDNELYCPRYGMMPSLIQFSFLDSTFLHTHTCIHMHTQSHTHKDTTYTDLV